MELHYYIKLFREIIGTSPLQYMQKLRIQYAAELIVDTDLTISEIAQLSGFNSPMYFSRVFKKHTNISPIEYRNNLS